MFPVSKKGVTFLTNLSFLSSTIEWNILNHDIPNSSSLNLFEVLLLKFFRRSK